MRPPRYLSSRLERGARRAGTQGSPPPYIAAAFGSRLIRFAKFRDDRLRIRYALATFQKKGIGPLTTPLTLLRQA